MSGNEKYVLLPSNLKLLEKAGVNQKLLDMLKHEERLSCELPKELNEHPDTAFKIISDRVLARNSEYFLNPALGRAPMIRTTRVSEDTVADGSDLIVNRLDASLFRITVTYVYITGTGPHELPYAVALQRMGAIVKSSSGYSFIEEERSLSVQVPNPYPVWQDDAFRMELKG